MILLSRWRTLSSELTPVLLFAEVSEFVEGRDRTADGESAEDRALAEDDEPADMELADVVRTAELRTTDAAPVPAGLETARADRDVVGFPPPAGDAASAAGVINALSRLAKPTIKVNVFIIRYFPNKSLYELLR